MVPDLNDIEPEALREAEFGTVQAVLDSMVGKRIVSATLDETHIEIRTDDGSAYSFYGFLGSSDRNGATPTAKTGTLRADDRVGREDGSDRDVLGHHAAL